MSAHTDHPSWAGWGEKGPVALPPAPSLWVCSCGGRPKVGEGDSPPKSLTVERDPSRHQWQRVDRPAPRPVPQVDAEVTRG